MKIQIDKDYDTYEITSITYCEDGNTRVEYKNLFNNKEDYYVFDGYFNLKDIVEKLQKIVK